MTKQNRQLAYVLKRFPRLSETFVAAEILELQRQGEHVTVFAISRPEESVAHGFLRNLTVPVIYLPHRPLFQPVRVGRAVWSVVRANPRGWLAAAWISLWPPRLVGLRRLLQATVLCAEMKHRGIDHAHAHFATAAARLVNLARRMGGPTYSVTAHAKDIYHQEVQQDHLRDKLGNALFTATVTEENRQYLLPIVGDATKIHVVSNAVDIRSFVPPADREPQQGRILTVARLVEKKGIADLIEACRILTERNVVLHLDIVGAGELRSQLEVAARRAGITATFHGALPREKVLELYRRAQVFCLPCIIASTGDRDGLPTSVLEAMALCVPVVTTPINGLAEVVVHERTGLLVPPHDPPVLACALQRILDDGDLASRLAREGRRRIETSFSLEGSVARLRSLFPEPV